MKLSDLMLKVKNELEAKGFTMEAPWGYYRQAHAHKDGKCEWKPVKGFAFNHLFGFQITFEIVYRSNGTSENISVDIKIYEWNNSNGQLIAKERINTKMGEKAIMTRINKIVEIYEAL